MSSTHKRRFFEIAATILEVCRNGARRTHIMYRANLSFDQLNRYLKILTRARLIRVDSDEKHYRLTEKGISFLRDYFDLENTIKTYNSKKASLLKIISSGRSAPGSFSNPAELTL